MVPDVGGVAEGGAAGELGVGEGAGWGCHCGWWVVIVVFGVDVG